MTPPLGQLVAAGRGELPAYEIIVDRRTGPDPPVATAGDHRVDAVLPAEPVHPVLARTDAVLGHELIGDEPIAEDRIVGMDLASRLDEMRASDQSLLDTGLARHL